MWGNRWALRDVRPLGRPKFRQCLVARETLEVTRLHLPCAIGTSPSIVLSDSILDVCRCCNIHL